MFPFEKFDADTVSDSVLVLKADEFLATGWHKRGYDRINLHNPIVWKMQSQEKRSHNFHIQAWDMLDSILRAHSCSHDVKYLAVPLPIALDWISQHTDSQAEGISPFAWYDMAVGLRAYRLAYIFQAADNAGLLTDATRQVLWCSLEQHASYLEDDKNITFHSNHGYYQIVGQMAMGRRLASQSDSMARAQQQAIERLQKILETQFSLDGVHRENSPDYHRMVYETLKASIYSGLITDEKIIDFAKRIEEALSWFVFPNGHIVNFGDSDDRSLVRLLKKVEDKWITPEMQFWGSGCKLGQPPKDTVRVFENSGYWIVRKSGENPKNQSQYSYLALNAAFHSRTHKHADDLSFVWYDRGQNLLVDAGRYGYIGKTEKNSEQWLDGYWYTDPWRMYCESTRAHNTLEFDERNSPRKGVKPYGSALNRWGATDSGIAFVEAECKHFSSIRHMRMLIFMPGKWLVVLDWFHDNNEATHKVRQWFHLGHELQLLAEQDQYLVPVQASTEPLRVAALLSEMQPSKIYIGEEKPVIQGWWSAKERDIVPNYAFCYELPEATSGVYATLFTFSNTLQIDKVWSKVNTSCRRGQFRWKDESGFHELYFDRPPTGDLLVSTKRIQNSNQNS